MSEVKKLLGAKLDRPVADYLAEPTVLHLKAIPAEFDSRQQWPTCIHPIRDQQQCGCVHFTSDDDH